MKPQTLSSAAILLLPAIALAGDRKDSSPNILFIQCDQLNTMALSCYGGPVPTPNLDRLASEGVLFRDAICPTPTSSPSRASIVTSQYTHQHGVVRNVPRVAGITDKDITTDRILYNSGYATHHYGKWHLASDNESNLKWFPDPFGFSEYRKENEEKFKEMRNTIKDSDWMKADGTLFPVELSKDKKEQQERLREKWSSKQYADMAINMGRLKMEADEWFDAYTTRNTINTLKKYAGSQKPFSITCSYLWPHDPNFVPEPYYSAVDPDKIKLSDITFLEEQFKKDWSHEMAAEFGEEGLKEFLRIYYACVMYIDDQVGELLETLEKTGERENTIVIFTADHGDMMTAHDMAWKSTGAFYKEIVNVPLIISYPGHTAAGKICNAQVNLVDIMPTLLELSGNEIPESAEGKSLVPLITKNGNDKNFRKYNFCERIHSGKESKGRITREIKPDYTTDVMVQDNEWKYIKYANGKEYLYDRSNDPDEINNLCDDMKYVKVKAKMAKAIDKWLNDTGWKN